MNADKKVMTYQDIIDMDYYDMMDYLDKYNVKVPEDIDNPQDMHYAGSLIGISCNNYTFISTLLSYARHNVRIAKQTGNRFFHEEAIDKRDAIEDMTKRIDKQMSASSRMITARVSELKELNINNCM